VFAVSDDATLQLIGQVPSNGTTPISLAVSGNRLFVLNAGSNSIAGFSLDDDHCRRRSQLDDRAWTDLRRGVDDRAEP